MNSKVLSDPRQESFVQMLHFSVCPLLKRNSFTYWICLIDILLYLISLLYQQTYAYALRPHQKVLFHFGQLYPFYATTELWRLILSLEQHKNEIHLAFSILFKLHFFSFIEYMLGSKKTMIMYLIGGITSTLFQAIFSKQAGVCGSFHIGIICYALYLQTQLLQKCTPQQQLQFYFDLQSSQDFGNSVIKITIVMIIMFVISIKFSGILMIGSLGFGIQCTILGQYFQAEQKKPQQLQLINLNKQRQWAKYFYLGLAIGIIVLEIIVFLQFKTHVEI